MSDKDEMFKEFYNYKYWREVQRNQLTTSSDIYFGFSSVLIGYSINFLMSESSPKTTDPYSKTLLAVGIALNLLSLFFYARSANNRLNDYRKTSREIFDGSTPNQIRNWTQIYGEQTWDNYGKQKFSLAIGVVLCLIAYSIIIFQK